MLSFINFLTASISVAFQLNLINEMEWLTTAGMFLHMQAHGLFNNDLSPSPWHELGSALRGLPINLPALYNLS